MHDIDELVAHLTRTTGLELSEARRTVLDLLDLLTGETPDAYVTRRHAELKAGGALKNDEIFQVIAEEMAVRPFAAPPLTQRQIRRLIYG